MSGVGHRHTFFGDSTLLKSSQTKEGIPCSASCCRSVSICTSGIEPV